MTHIKYRREANYRVVKSDFDLDTIVINVVADDDDEGFWYDGTVTIPVWDCYDRAEAEGEADAVNSFSELRQSVDVLVSDPELLADYRRWYGFDWADCLTPEQGRDILRLWKERQRLSFVAEE